MCLNNIERKHVIDAIKKAMGLKDKDIDTFKLIEPLLNAKTDIEDKVNDQIDYFNNLFGSKNENFTVGEVFTGLDKVIRLTKVSAQIEESIKYLALQSDNEWYQDFGLSIIDHMEKKIKTCLERKALTSEEYSLIEERLNEEKAEILGINQSKEKIAEKWKEIIKENKEK